MASRPKPPVRLVRPDRPERPSGSNAPDPYAVAPELPLPEVIEKDTDSVWAMWNEALEDKHAKDADTMPATLLMGLPEPPKDADGT